MRRYLRTLAVASGFAVLALPLLAAPAAAHEGREVGKYHFVVGFGDEPAYAGFKNSVSLSLTGPGGKAVTDLGDSLTVAVSAGDQRMELPLEPLFGEAGEYRAYFVPTAAGDYTFRFSGELGGQQVDETFESGPDTFSPVQDTRDLQFPAKGPSTVEIGQRLDRALPRMEEALAASQAAEQDARDAAGQARLLAIAGLLMGVAGLVTGGLALRKRG